MKQPVELNGKTILVTGSPGFIGANLTLRLLKEMNGGTVISFDNMNDYYDPKLKEYRLGLIEKAAKASKVKHVFIRGSIADKALVDKTFAEYRPAVVVNLAAQAGVRYSIDHPDVYIESNLIGFYNILEACRHAVFKGAFFVSVIYYTAVFHGMLTFNVLTIFEHFTVFINNWQTDKQRVKGSDFLT